MSKGINRERIDRLVEKENLNTYWRPYGFPDIMRIDASNISGADQMPRWTEPGPVAISCAINGAFFTKRENPNQPTSREEIVRSAEECIAEGATIIHVHARDERGYNVLSPDAFKGIVGDIKSKHPDVSIDACLVAVNDAESADLRRMIDTRMLDAVPVNATAIILGDNLFVKPPHAIIEKTRLVVEAGLTPQIAVYTDGDIDNARRFIVEAGFLRGPFTWLIIAGLPGCSPMYSSFSMVEGLLRQVRLIREIDPGANIIVCAGGRGGSHLAALAVLLGLHVRVGMEDTVWKWPHRDDLIDSNAEMFVMIRDIARNLGREVMTGSEYRTLTASQTKAA